MIWPECLFKENILRRTVCLETFMDNVSNF